MYNGLKYQKTNGLECVCLMLTYSFLYVFHTLLATIEKVEL